MRLVAILLVSALAVPTFAQDRPLPDAKAFLEEVRKRLQTDDERQSSYMFVETRKEHSRDKAGNQTLKAVKVFENYPGLPGEARWERLIAVDGKLVPASELDKKDRERQKEVEEYLQKRAKETDKDRAAAGRERDKERRESSALIDDVFRVFDIQMLGREPLEEHDTIAFALTPRPGAKAQTKDGKVMRHFKGKAWVSESEYEPVRLEIEALDTVSFGLGIVVRLHKGSRGAFQRRKVNGEEWLPASASSLASARVLLLKRLQYDITSDFSGYKKFTVATDTTFTPPK